MWCSLWDGERGGEDRLPAVVVSQVPKAGPGARGGGGIGCPRLWYPRSQRRDLGHPAVAVSAGRSCGIPGPKGGTWGTRRWRYRPPAVVESQVPKAGPGAPGGGGIGCPELWYPRSQRRDLGHSDWCDDERSEI